MASFMDVYSLNNNGIIELLGKKLREFRMEANMTQGDLAKAAGVSLSTVQSVERGANISLENFVKLLRALRRFDMIEPFFLPKPISPIVLASVKGVIKQKRRVRK